MHSERLFPVFSKLQGLSSELFPKNFRCNLTFYESDNFFLYLSPAQYLDPKTLSFVFLRKLGGLSIKYEKLNFRKS